MRNLMALLGLSAVMAVPTVQAEVSDQEFDQLKQMLESALERIDELESQQTTDEVVQSSLDADQAGVDVSLQEQVAANTARLEKVSWTERFKIKGDFRYRYQNDDVDDTQNSVPGSSDFGDINENGSRNRNRIRARLGIYAQLPQDVEVGFALASGSDDPVSANTTLGGGGESKDIFLDMAYFDWSGLENTNIRGGKFKNTFEMVGKSQLQWDGDWRPEGADIAWDNDRFFAQALGTYLEADSNKDTEFAYLLQAGARMDLGPVKFIGGAGFTSIDAEGSECFYEGNELSGKQTCLGNESVTNSDLNEEYINDFTVYNIFASAGFDAFGQPINFFGDYIKNSDADDNDQGYLVGFQIGKVKGPGSWQFKYYYEDIESNATLALLANSDFGGGGTNGKGSVFSAGYGLTKQTNLKLTYYLVERNSDNLNVINNGDEFDADTMQADINFKFK
jgi:type II secretory pathway pseudopilin PulG